MKRYFIALGAAAFVGSTVLASAAALDVTGGVAQHGITDAGDLTCDPDGVTVNQRWDTDYPENGSLGPQFIGLSDDCEGQYIVAHAYDSNDDLISHSVPILVPATTSPWVNANWENFVGLDEVERVKVTIIS